MNENIFLPRLKNLNKDNISEWLQVLAGNVFVLVFGLLPIFFIPNNFTSLGFTKTYFVAIGIFIVLFLYSLSVLRKGIIKFSIPLALASFWTFFLIALASGMLSGDRLDSILGNFLEVQTVGFLLLFGIVITISTILSDKKPILSRLFIFVSFSSVILLTAQVLRVFFGPDFLSFGLFTNETNSYIGSFNDLALFSALVTIVSLLVLQNINLKLWGKVLAAYALATSLLLLAIINFFTVWVAVGVFSLLMLLYVLAKDTWLSTDKEDRERKVVSGFLLIVVSAVVVVSFAFVIAGNYLGTSINNFTGISYLEVRPSHGATLDIIKETYSNNILLGVGPNRFEDAWRMYKNPIINQTDFWGTDFSAGSGLMSTLFVTTGLAGGILFIIFLLSFLHTGYRTLFSGKLDKDWQTVGVISFAAATFLWLMSIFYLPGAVIMLFTALFTGLTLAVYNLTSTRKTIDLDVTKSRQYGFVLITAVLLVIVGGSVSIFNLSKQYLAQANYANTVRAFAQGNSLFEIDVMLEKSETLFAQDTFPAERARLRLFELNRLNSLPEPTAEDEQSFQLALVEGITLAEKAISLDYTNPYNHILLASFYGQLNSTAATEIQTRMDNSLARARALDPLNPSYLVLFAQFSAQHGNFSKAREYLQEALSLKVNYTDALFLLSQIDIREGNTESAIAVTQEIISIEPFNPTRYFQLGVLLTTSDDLNGAIRAFEQAVMLDRNYANARYLLALTYIDAGREEEALEQLKIIEITNPENQELKQLITMVESGNFVRPETDFALPISEDEVVERQDDVTVSSRRPNTRLVQPLNQTPDRGDSSSEEFSEDLSASNLDELNQVE